MAAAELPGPPFPSRPEPSALKAAPKPKPPPLPGAPHFGQVVIGPPGAGKTTYCWGVQQFLQACGRSVAVVNLDPANDRAPYTAAVDVMELVSVAEVMDRLELGPNGGLVYCMEYLEANLDWLRDKLAGLQGKYILFDMPGQVELYTHHKSVQRLVRTLEQWGLRAGPQLAAVHLVDAHHCSDASRFISVLMLSLQAMLQLELPHVNVLSKADLAERAGASMPFPLEFFTEAFSMDMLLESLSDDAFGRRHKKLSQAICEMVEEFGLVHFHKLNIQDKESVHQLQRMIDKVNGYIYGIADEGKASYMMNADRLDLQPPPNADLLVREHYDEERQRDEGA